MKHDDLLEEIRNDPSSDPPRLVFADHLEQEGDLDRANLIRLQIRRANLPSWDPQVLGLALQERAILAKRGAEWRAQLPKLAGVQWGGFSRGFVGKVAFDSVEVFGEHRKKCLGASPVDSIALRWPGTAKPAKLGAIETIRELTIVGTMMKPEDLKWLAASPLLSTIRSLNLVDSEIRSGLPHLLKSPHLGKLEALRIPLHHLGNGGVSKLVAASLPSLVELDLSVGSDEELGSGRRSSSGSITSKGILELQSWPGMSRIQSLDLSGSKLGSEGLMMLLASVNTKRLKTLRIRNIKDSNWDMDDSLSAFKTGPAGSLDELDISNNDLDPDGAHYLAESKALRELKVLRMDHLRSTAFDRLGKASWIRSLRVLSCSEAPLPHILKRTPENLHSIRIAPGSAGLSKVVHALAADPPPVLTSLDLTVSPVDEAGLKRLGELALPKLTAFRLQPNLANLAREHVIGFSRSAMGAKLACIDTGIEDADRLPEPDPIDIGDGPYDGPYRYL